MAFEPQTPESKPEDTTPVAAVTESSTTTQTEVPSGTSQIPVAAAPKGKKTRAKWFLPAIIAGAVILLAGGGSYGYFAVYQQTPENLWKAGLKNTGEGLKSYIDNMPATPKSTKVKGSFKLASPVAADGSIEGSMDNKNATLKADAGAAGIRANLELRSITAEGQTSPDLYVKVDGLKAVESLLAGQYGDLSEVVNQVDNKWFSVDHSLLDQLNATIAQESKDAKLPSTEELQKEITDTSKKVATVLNDYLFTDNEAKAVVVVTENLAKEDLKGRKSQHVKVKVRKDQTKEFIKALRETVRGTSLEKQFLDSAGSNGELPTMDDVLKGLDNLNFDNAVADVWIDTGLKYIRNVRITNKEGDSTTSVDFTLDYKGGDEFPLSITVSGKDSTSEGSVTLGMTVNKKSSDVKLTAGIEGTFEEQKVSFTADLSATGSNDTISVEKPSGATNIMELVGSFMQQFQELQSELGAYGGGLTSSSLDCASQLQQYALTNGASAISDECRQDDSEL